MFLSLFVPVVSSIAAFFLGQLVEKKLHQNFGFSARRAEKFILKFLADGKERASNEVYLNASADGHAYLAVFVAHGNLSDQPRGNGKVKSTWRGTDQYMKLAEVA